MQLNQKSRKNITLFFHNAHYVALFIFIYFLYCRAHSRNSEFHVATNEQWETKFKKIKKETNRNRSASVCMIVIRQSKSMAQPKHTYIELRRKPRKKAGHINFFLMGMSFVMLLLRSTKLYHDFSYLMYFNSFVFNASYTNWMPSAAK